MACFADINVSQSSVVTYARYGRIFSMHLIANLPRNFLAKKICKSVKIRQNYGHESVAPFFGPPCIIGRGMRQDEDVHCYQNLYDESVVKSQTTVNIMARCDTGKMPIISFKVFQSEQSIVSSTAHRDCSATSDCRGVFTGVKTRRRRSYLGRYRYLITVIASVRWLQSRVHLGCIGCRHWQRQLPYLKIWINAHTKVEQTAAVSCGNRARLRTMFQTRSEARKSLNVAKISQCNQWTLFTYSIFSISDLQLASLDDVEKTVEKQMFITRKFHFTNAVLLGRQPRECIVLCITGPVLYLPLSTGCLPRE